MLGQSGEPLEGITHLNDVQSGVVLGVLFRGFEENGHDVIWCITCTARHEMGEGSDSDKEGDEGEIGSGRGVDREGDVEVESGAEEEEGSLVVEGGENVGEGVEIGRASCRERVLVAV